MTDQDAETVQYWLPDFPDDWDFDPEEMGDPYAALDRILARITELEAARKLDDYKLVQKSERITELEEGLRRIAGLTGIMGPSSTIRDIARSLLEQDQVRRRG